MSTDLKPNAELAYMVLDQIDAHPETWNQGRWWCGTGGCFAGWAVTLSGCQIDPDDYEAIVVQGPESLVGHSVEHAAQALLGTSGWVDVVEDDWLFCPTNTRKDLGRIVSDLFGPRPEPSGGQP